MITEKGREDIGWWYKCGF